MRIWHIPYCYLDSQRLVSQHNEIHGLTTVILKGKTWGSISGQFKHSVPYMEAIHTRCVDELAKRAKLAGRTVAPHTTDFPREYPGIHRSRQFKPTREDFMQDVQQLRAKWEAEGYNFGTGRLYLSKAEEQLGIEVKRTEAECREIQAQTKAFVKEHRAELKALGTEKRLWEKLLILGYQLPSN